MRKKLCSMEILVPISFILLSSLVNFSLGCCEQKIISAYLDAAADFISKAKSVNISCKGDDDDKELLNCGKPVDCADLKERGQNESGVYTVYPNSRLPSAASLLVYCDMTTDGGGWTVIQRRGNFGSEENLFDKDWQTYRKGFGSIEKDFWFGNDNIFALTNQKLYSVRFDLEDKNGKKAFAQYDSFWIDDEFNNFTLHISGYNNNSNAGDAMKNHNKMKFTTRDRHNDLQASRNCAEQFSSGWWFYNCYWANLNGVYNKNKNAVQWRSWKNLEGLPKAEIKIKPFVA